ncbi:hypothetical protein, partial [Caballeronia sordidicola]|uniref:hypothetical protein n=1 Tax=Caballeronia sordidicola TaxID=196367 RepID=UPI00117EF868
MSQKNSSNTVISSVVTGHAGSEIRGTSAPFSLVKIFEGLRLIGEAVAAADGAWSLPWLGSPGMGKHAFHATGSHGHHHHHHDMPVSAGAPSIAGISDSIQGLGGKFAKLTTIENPLPTMIGFGHAGDVISVFDGDHSIGSTTVHPDGTWAFSTPLLAKGTHEFFVGTVSAVSGVTLMSNHLVVHMVGDGIVVPSAVATITSALDEVIDPAGNHHDNVIQNGGKTVDTSPQLHGTISTALHEGEVLAIYRDGQKIGTASVTGLDWSYQDEGLTKGQHVYTASVISASGEQGVHSEDFVITETAGTGSGFQLLATEDFLIFDTRFEARATSDGKAISVDMLEGVRMLEKAGMTVKSYTDNGGVISIEVDWVAYMKAHPEDPYLDLDMHRHIDNDQGGLNYYNLIAVPDY